MKTEYRKEYLHTLGREVEYKIYGHSGKPVLFIPCMNGRFFDFENYRMTDTWAPWIESGQVQVFAVDTIDTESLTAQGEPRGRIEWYDTWVRAIAEELLPRMKDHNTWCSGGDMGPFMTFGCSLGAFHAALFFFRYPEKFDTVLALSGLYDLDSFFGGYHDDLTYANSPADFLAGMPADHPYIELYNRANLVFCVGQGAWEDELIAGTARLQNVCREKGIRGWFDFWGTDVDHDWPWWYRQCDYFLPKLLGEPRL